MRKVVGLGLRCPFCGRVTNGKIIDTRAVLGKRRRRRVCEFCGERFSTYEECAVKQRRYVKDNDGGWKLENKPIG